MHATLIVCARAQQYFEKTRALRLDRRSQGHGRFRGEKQKGKRLLQVKFYSGVSVAQITNRNVLPDVKIEIAATRGYDEGSLNRGRPDDFVVDKPFYVFKHGISLIARFGERSVGVRPEQNRVGAVDSDKAQPAQSLSDRVRIFSDVARERHLRIAGSLPDANNPGGVVAFENGSIFGESELPCSVLCGLPVGIVRATIDVVDGLARQFERNAQFNQRFNFALSRDDAALGSRNFGRRDFLQMPGAHRRERRAGRPLYVDNAAPGKVTLERARSFFFDLSPRAIGNRRQFAMQVIHEGCLL